MYESTDETQHEWSGFFVRQNPYLHGNILLQSDVILCTYYANPSHKFSTYNLHGIRLPKHPTPRTLTCAASSRRSRDDSARSWYHIQLLRGAAGAAHHHRWRVLLQPRCSGVRNTLAFRRTALRCGSRRVTTGSSSSSTAGLLLFFFRLFAALISNVLQIAELGFFFGFGCAERSAWLKSDMCGQCYWSLKVLAWVAQEV